MLLGGGRWRLLGTGHVRCDDAPMSELLEGAAPAGDDSIESTPMRLAGFSLTAFAGMLIGVGALMPWIRSSIAGLPDELSPTYYGIDLPDGLVVLVTAVVVLAGLAITRLTSSRRARRLATGAIIAGSFVALSVAGVAALGAAGRFEPAVVDDVLGDLDPSGIVTADQREQIEELVETRLEAGPFVAIAGGVLGIIGGLLVLSWTARAPADG